MKNTANKVRSYRSPLREAQAEATRERIVDTAIQLLAEDPTTFTMPAVAKRAGVSQPTVYRLFPDKEALTEAARESVRKRANVQSSLAESSVELMARLAASIRRIQLEPASTLPGLAVLTAQQLSEEDLKARATYIAGCLKRELKGVPAPVRRRLANIISLFFSSTGATALWRQRLFNEEGIEMLEWMVQSLVEAAQRETKQP